MSAHTPNPWHEVQDHKDGLWTFFEDFFGLGIVQLPLLNLRPYGIPFTLTRFMIIEVIAAVIVALLFIWLAKRLRSGELPKGRAWNALEALLIFVRNDIARPVFGEKEAEPYLPYLWTVFFFVLTCNLLGLVPLMGSPTASIWMTGGLAFLSFVLFHAIPIRRIGFLNYLKTMWVSVDVPPSIPLGKGVRFSLLGIVISLVLFVIEMLGTFIKATVLAIRLFANIFAGHIVVATILLFAVAANVLTVKGIAISAISVLGAAILCLLELLVAFLQAYIFTFLTALFISLPLLHHAEHEAAHGHEDHAPEPGHGHEPAPAHGH